MGPDAAPVEDSELFMRLAFKKRWLCGGVAAAAAAVLSITSHGAE